MMVLIAGCDIEESFAGKGEVAKEFVQNLVIPSTVHFCSNT
jgi:hypothetical protein